MRGSSASIESIRTCLVNREGRGLGLYVNRPGLENLVSNYNLIKITENLFKTN